ncbi:SDR family NAD(P)-dependent oxidoreductase [Almyronema epifaneia]|uniref:SDR family NAD(P)-dependent oxidoreductase n=1 Tax=Almyronema epifaneia S1 TaxID=2991925 RepID=A0ABW6ICC9_9CYAN
MKSLAGKVAIITGGSGGLGSATCLRLAREGAAIAVHYASRQAKADAVVKDLEKMGGKAIAIPANVSNGDEVKQLFGETEKRLDQPDIGVNKDKR